MSVDRHVGPWTLTDVLALPEGPAQRVELVGGKLMMSPAPGLPHQRASHRLHNLLEQAAAAGEVFEAINVVVPDGLLIPDLVVIDAMASAEMTAVPAHDVLLVVKIASPSTRVTDRKLKPQLYAAAGIGHYWRIELEPAPRLIASELHVGGYAETEHLAGATARIEDPFPVAFDPAVLARRQPA
ncbi:Uma2 family endonuclease [Streptomyces sp. NPDC015501]|uniref:Uma2 family endonuclease n=1 Tax=unclassified Streptomyces TaxID=2593676 RepID=UPI0011A322E3|nr:hypothetical protein A3L22_29265 [Streptomyces griseus subsp. griseus]